MQSQLIYNKLHSETLSPQMLLKPHGVSLTSAQQGVTNSVRIYRQLIVTARQAFVRAGSHLWQDVITFLLETGIPALLRQRGQ